MAGHRHECRCGTLKRAPLKIKAMSAPAPTARVVGRFFELSLLGMLSAGYFALLASGALDWPTAAVALAALITRAFMIRLDPPGRLIVALTLLYFGFYALDYFYLSQSFLIATVH